LKLAKKRYNLIPNWYGTDKKGLALCAHAANFIIFNFFKNEYLHKVILKSYFIFYFTNYNIFKLYFKAKKLKKHKNRK